MIRQKVKVINKLGLHARAALKLINCAARFQSEIQLLYRNNTVNAKSIMNVMALSVSQGNEIELVIEGPDEQAALSDLEQLFSNRFGENE